MAYRKEYPKIETTEIETFEKKYKGSQMEKDDLLVLFEKLKGDMTHLLQYAILSSNGDIPRLIGFYETQIKTGKISDHLLAFEKTKKSVKKEAEETREALKSKKEQLLRLLTMEK